MDHATAKKNLSAFLDGAVTPEEKVLLEEHLETCPECRAELRELAEAVSRLRSLGHEEPPPWLTVKVMARIRQEAGQERGLLRRLFTPFGWKLRLEAVALVFLTVTGYLVYRSVSPEMGSVVPVVGESGEQSPVPTPADKGKPATGRDSARRPSTKGPQPPAAGRGETVQTPPAQQPTLLPQAEVPAMVPAPLPEQPRMHERMEGASRGLRDESGYEPLMEKAAPPAASRAKSLSPGPAERIRRQLAVDDLDAAIRNIRSAARKAAGKTEVIGTGDAEGTVVVHLERKRLGEFLERLPAVGEVLDRAQLPSGEEAVLHVVIEVSD